MSLLINIAPFSGLRANVLAVLDSQLRIRQYSKGVGVYSEGDIAAAVFIVLHGTVKTYTANDKGRKLTFREHASGEAFGMHEILLTSPRLCSAIAKEDTTIAIVQATDFRTALSTSPELWRNISAFLTKDLAQMIVRLKHLALFDIHGRVKNLLHASSRKIDGRLTVDKRITQQEIADRVGSSRERVSFVLSKMKQAGALYEYKGRLVLAENV